MTRQMVQAQMLCFAISSWYARKNGAHIVLHTDMLGANMLQACPYNEIYLTLRNTPLNPNIAPFWAAGKLLATATEPVGSVHIDGDVFIKEGKILETIEQSEADLFTQNEEGEKWRVDDTYSLSQKCIGQDLTPTGLHIDYALSYNCGVTRFRNKQLKQDYINTYFNTVNDAVSDKQFMDRYHRMTLDESRKGSIIPDIVVEQQFLHEIATRGNYKVDCLLHGDIEKYADEMGYVHFLSARKYRSIPELKKHLEYLSPQLYQAITTNPIFLANDPK